MRARFRTQDYETAFSGPGATWNELLRPIFGGPEAPDETAPAGRSAHTTTASDTAGSDTLTDSDEKRAPRAPRRATRSAAAAMTAPARSAVDALMAALSTMEGRRAEKEAVLAAVWSLGDGNRDITFAEVADVLSSYDGFGDVRVKPLILKHMSRTKLLEPGSARETVRLTPKGRKHLAQLARG